MQCIHAVCSFINTLTLLFVGIQLLNIRKTWSNNGLFGSCSTVWLHFDDPTGLASTSSYGWHCSDVDGALRKLQMLAWIGRGDVCLGSPVGVGLGCDFRTSQGASKIDSGFFFVYRKCISCQIWLFWVYIYISISTLFFLGGVESRSYLKQEFPKMACWLLLSINCEEKNETNETWYSGGRLELFRINISWEWWTDQEMICNPSPWFAYVERSCCFHPSIRARSLCTYR